MSRTCKVGVSYFTHDTDLFQDIKIRFIKAKHGLLGYAVYLRLLEELYRENGYFLKVNEEFNILFVDDCKIEYNVYNSVLNDCIEKELFNKEIYEKYEILTSKRIQKNYCDAVHRRKEVDFIEEYLLIEIVDNPKMKDVNVNILKLNADIGTQRKEKKKKEDKRKENDLAKNVSIIFDYWINVMEKQGNTLLTPKRKKAIEGRIKDKYSVEDIKKAIDGCKNSSFHQGNNKEGKKHNDIELICRDGEKLENFRDYEPTLNQQQSGYQWVT